MCLMTKSLQSVLTEIIVFSFSHRLDLVPPQRGTKMTFQIPRVLLRWQWGPGSWISFPPKPVGHNLRSSFLFHISSLFSLYSTPDHSFQVICYLALLFLSKKEKKKKKQNLVIWGLSYPRRLLYGGENCGPQLPGVNAKATQIDGRAGFKPERLYADQMPFKDIMLPLKLPIRWDLLPRIKCAFLTLPVYRYLVTVATEVYPVL